MKLMTLAAPAAALSLLSSAAFAEIVVSESFARGGDRTGAAFMMIENTGDTDDRVISARSEAAARVELHTHIEDEGGVMRMREVEEFALPAGGMAMLERGGDHVMLMGLVEPLEQGAEVEITLVFENAEPLTITVPVDNERGGHGMGHGSHGGHGHDGHGDHGDKEEDAGMDHDHGDHDHDHGDHDHDHDHGSDG
ncbi:MAG: copper chaperone PCu(A)C [Shimia sp.]